MVGDSRIVSVLPFPIIFHLDADLGDRRMFLLAMTALVCLVASVQFHKLANLPGIDVATHRSFETKSGWLGGFFIVLTIVSYVLYIT
jgi:hypothetical protein